MTFETLAFVFLVVIFALELIFGSMLIKAASYLETQLQQVYELIYSVKKELQAEKDVKNTPKKSISSCNNQDFII